MLSVSTESEACINTIDFLSDPGLKTTVNTLAIRSIAYHMNFLAISIAVG